MKYLLILIVGLFIMNSTTYSQQNHVPNCSFETYTQCASTLVSTCVGWRMYTNGSSDYFKACGGGAPNNFAGYQHAAHGQAYMGGYTYVRGHSSIYKEYVATEITPLQPGAVYEVSMSVSLSNNSKYATNDLGVYFYDSNQYTQSHINVLNVTPQISYASYGIIRDTQNWVRLTKTFVADSTYDNIVVGGFAHYNNITLDSNSTNGTYSYYYIDSIVVKKVDSFSLVVADSLHCAGDTFTTSYRTTKKYNSNNIFTAQLSDKNGNFSVPINIGTKAADTTGTITCIIPSNIGNGTGYKVRVIASSTGDTTKNQSINLKIANIDSSAVTAGSNSPICQGSNINLYSGTNLTSTTYQWTGPNSFNASLANTSIGGASPIHSGNYYITMKFYGCEVKDTVAITIKPLAVKPVANNNTPVCAGGTINFTATTTTPGITYSWTGPNSYTSSIQNPTISNSTVGMSGDYIVAADLNGCKTTDTTTVTVKPLPTPVTLSNNSALCAGDTLKLYSTASTTGATYTWAGSGSFASSTQNAAIPNSTANMTGWYKMTVDLNACQYIDSTYATIHPIPTMPVVGFNTPLCVGETLNLTASTVSGATYSWTGANSFTANTQNPARSSITTSHAGVYHVTATVNGCTSPAGSANIAINPSPFVVIFPTPGDSICQGDPVVFTALPNNTGGVPQYRWLVNAQQVGTGTVFNTSALSNGDVVRCDMIEYTKCSNPYTDQSNDIEMKVLPWLTPSVTISASPNRTLEVDEYVTFTATPNNGGSAPQYQWKRNGQNIQGATGSVWSANTLNDNDQITAELISNYKCPQPPTAVSNSITVRVATSIKNTNAIKGLSLYPNPNNGSFTIKGTVNNNDKILIQVMSGIGQLVYKQEITPANNTVSENITLDGGLASGVYFVKLVVNGQARVIPMTVSR